MQNVVISVPYHAHGAQQLYPSNEFKAAVYNAASAESKQSHKRQSRTSILFQNRMITAEDYRGVLSRPRYCR